MKRKKIMLCMVFLAFGITATGCANLWKSEKAQNILSGEALRESEEEEVPYQEERILFGEFKGYQMGDEIEVEQMSGDSKSAISYSLKNLQICNSPEEAGIDMSELKSTEYYMEKIPKRINPEDMLEMKLVVCEVEIKSKSSGGHERSINEFDIVYESEEGDLEKIGSPVYFSEHMEEPGGSKYYFYIASEEPKLCKVIWAVEEDTLEKYEFYFCHGYRDGDNKHLIPIEK